MENVECSHIYAFAGFADENWLIYTKEDLIKQEDDIMEFFNFCPSCGIKLVED